VEILKVQNLSKVYGKGDTQIKALDDISFGVEKGDFVGRAALARAKEAGLTRTLVGLEMVERGIARDEYRCMNGAWARVAGSAC